MNKGALDSAFCIYLLVLKNLAILLFCIEFTYTSVLVTDKGCDSQFGQFLRSRPLCRQPSAGQPTASRDLIGQ